MAEIPAQTLEAASREAEAPAARFTDPVSEVEKLLNPEPAQDEPSPEMGDQAEQDTQPGESWDLKSVAEKLQTDPAKLYESLKVALEDGTEISVSALKDAHKPVAELDKARTKLVEEVTSAKRDIVQAEQELVALLTHPSLAQHLTPELLRSVQDTAAAKRSTEAERLLARIPEWKDPVTRAADWADIRTVGREHGFTDAELKLAEEGYADHRLLSLLRAAAKGSKPPAPAKPAAKVAVKPSKGGNTSEAQRFGQLKAARTTGRMSPEAAVQALLRGN